MYTCKYRSQGVMCLTSVVSQSMEPVPSHFPSAPIKLPCTNNPCEQSGGASI